MSAPADAPETDEIRPPPEAGRPRVWWYRAPLLVPMAAFLVGHGIDPAHRTIVSGINLVMHEGGHLFFFWFGSDVLSAAGGTLFQLTIPCLVGWMFLRQGDRFAAAVCLFWVGLNLAEIAPYAADAQSRLLPLVSPFPGAPQHDWHFLLTRAGVLSHDQLVGRAFRDAGLFTMAAGLLWTGAALRTMAKGFSGQSPEQVGGSSVTSLNTSR